MTWLALLRLLLQLAEAVAGQLRDDQLRKDGEARATIKQLEKLHEKIGQALSARLDDGGDGELRDDDGHRRD